jgi:hypothetical protein
MKRIKILVGSYGSGKSELCVNMAMGYRKEGKPVVLVDLDVINPYYGSSNMKEQLEKAGVRVVVPPLFRTGVDLPALGPEVMSAFAHREEEAIFDVGGDATGATVLGRYKPFFEKEGYEMLFIMNLFRPDTTNERDALALMDTIEAKSRMHITGIINNTHLAQLTTAEQVMEGQKLAEACAKARGIAVEAIAAKPDIAEKLPEAWRDLVWTLDLALHPKARYGF